jgi:wyosine [tRNA(Phe)-imidazoG37] synthetase (radical SAM superfamily)
MMPGFLFHEVVFGPVRSRRLGLSLGINLLPLHSKYCSFNCIYCECGWTPPDMSSHQELPSRAEVAMYLGQRLKELASEDHLPDAITYAGNGEPTLHPDFAGIVDDTIALRDAYAPGAKVTVLSNATMIQHAAIFSALQKLDQNILKLDAGNERMFGLINNPVEPVNFDVLVENLKKFNGNLIIQSMFLRGLFKGQVVDNTTSQEVEGWLRRLKEINPAMVMIYPVARETPVHNLEKISLDELEQIALKVRQAGINVQVYQ